MERFAIFLLPILLCFLLLRMLILPLRFFLRFGIHAGCGLLCLGILNSVSGFTGIFLPVNPVTVAMAGFGGLPGIGLIALLAMI